MSEEYKLDRTIANPVTWSGKTSSFHHKWNSTPNPPDTKKGFRKVWYLDAQWSDCPVEVEDQVKEMWRNYDLGNDYYCINTSISSLFEQEYFVVAQYVLEQHPNIEDDELIIIHWWW
jgi:hypothetical protein